jgi:hypothetical protein
MSPPVRAAFAVCGVAVHVAVVQGQNKKACMSYLMQAQRKPGSVLLSHQVALAVPSAPRSLTSEFGMGSGVASLISPPEIVGPASSGQALAASVIAEAALERCELRNSSPELRARGSMIALEVWSSRTTY